MRRIHGDPIGAVTPSVGQHGGESIRMAGHAVGRGDDVPVRIGKPGGQLEPAVDENLKRRRPGEAIGGRAIRHATRNEQHGRHEAGQTEDRGHHATPENQSFNSRISI